MWPIVLGLATLIQIEGSTDCPAATAVREALAHRTPTPRAARIQLTSEAGTLRLVLVDQAGRPRAERRLPASGSCAELAEAAALVVTVWDRELDASRMPLPALEPPALVRRAPSRISYDVAARALVSWELGAGVAAGGAVDATVGQRAGHWALRMGARGLERQTHPVGPGQIEWTRPALSVGARYQLAPAHWRVDVHAEALAALLVVRANGDLNGHEELDFDSGLGGGVRGGYLLGAVEPFVEVGVAGWLRPQSARIAGLQSGYDLPRLELLISAGLAVAQ